MYLEQLKQECNAKYSRLLNMLENHEDLNSIHMLLLDVVEALYGIGNVSREDRESTQIRAKELLKVDDGITKESRHADIYYELTGSRLNDDYDPKLVDLTVMNKILIDK